MVPSAELMREAGSLALKLAGRPAHALSVLKDSVQNGLSMSLHEALNFEIKNFILTFASEDRREGFSAFMEKRKPRFYDR